MNATTPRSDCVRMALRAVHAQWLLLVSPLSAVGHITSFKEPSIAALVTHEHSAIHQKIPASCNEKYDFKRLITLNVAFC